MYIYSYIIILLLFSVIAEGNRLLQDTPYADTWIVYHDALSAWWPKDLPIANAADSGKLPGDSPEYMPLDSNLFSNLEVMVRWNVAATCELPRHHESKFDLTTPQSAWSAVCRTWKYAPTSARIVEDIERVFVAIEEVVKHEGIAVDFAKLRSGRREEAHRRSARRMRAQKNRKNFDMIEGLHPIAKQCIKDLCVFLLDP